mmetsp:Transcript_136057/g.339304  ORF Transcript_136057/g.339304 Transcript_136057/m.339304 type:complete len:129 (+) Transcript_136057:1139-1525(+)
MSAATRRYQQLERSFAKPMHGRVVWVAGIITRRTLRRKVKDQAVYRPRGDGQKTFRFMSSFIERGNCESRGCKSGGFSARSKNFESVPFNRKSGLVVQAPVVRVMAAGNTVSKVDRDQECGVTAQPLY